ncbi:hypothetical protein [Microbacterium sp. CGR1]|uniref:hypothetical protein n=1 Tax=Microbacterium sp. CGR1 TaxID=1696072 RepID=UPI003DA3788B
MPRVLATFVAVIALVVGVFVPVASVSAAPSATIGAAQGRDIKMSLDGFDPGNIISDAVFTDRGTMTEAQIQAFFNSKVARCQGGSDKYGPIICLKDFTITSVNRPADRYCQGYSGAPNESAARIIYRVAQSCGINPQVLIVMLQKEQGLVTHTWPSMNRYNAALGQGCPDGGVACDPNYVGFFHQIYGAARQMQIYMEGRYFTYYAPGKTWNILYNPNRNCGSAPVYVSNMATSALYYYTPYQPNPAALRAGYGEGDGCSAYGNRNFYNYFTDWFGSTKSSGARLLRDVSTGVTYLVSGSMKYPFPTAERAVQFSWISTVQDVTTAQLGAFVDGGWAPRAVQTDTGRIYLLNSGRRYQVPSCAQALNFAWNCATLPVVSQAQVNNYPDEGFLAPSIYSAGTTWFMQGGYRREIVDTSLLLQYGISPAVSLVADAVASDYWTGEPVLGPALYSDGGDKATTILPTGAVYNVPAAARTDMMIAWTRKLTPETFAKLKPTGDLPLATYVDGSNFILGNDGWIAVDSYGSAVNFVPLPSTSINAMPIAAASRGPHFVRERSSLQIYFVSGGLRTVSPEEQRWIAAAYGVPSTVRIVADGALGQSSTPANPLPSKGLVKSADGAAYLIDGANRYRLRDCSQVANWGADCAQLTTVTGSQLSQATDRGWLDHLIRRSDGTIWLIQSGARREVLDPSLLAPYGIGSSTTTLTNSILDTLPLAAPVLGSGVYSDGASGMIIVNTAGTFTVAAENRVPAVTGAARKLSAASFALMVPQAALPSRMLSDGRALVLTERGWLQVDPAHYGGTTLFAQVGSAAWGGVPLIPFEGRPHFVRERSTNQQFLVSGGAIQPIKDDASKAWIVAQFGVPATVWVLADGALKGMALPVGTIFRDADTRVLLSDGGSFFQFTSCDAVVAFGATCADIPTVSTAQLGMTSAGTLARILRSPDGVLWLLQQGMRREVPDPAVLAAYGIPATSTPVSSALITGVKVGTPVVAAGPYRDGAGAIRLVLASGKVLDVPVAARTDVLVAQAKRLTDASFAQIPGTGTLSVRAEASGAHYVLSSQGWLRVDPANYGSLAFPTVAAEVIAAIPAGETAIGPRFVREMSGAQVYLASGGLTPVNAEQQAAITQLYGVPAAVIVVANGSLR